MSEEEIKEYLKKFDELELKLTDEDKDTYQWLLFGYNKCARLLNEKEQENKQLKNDNAVMKAGLIQASNKQLNLYKEVIEEVREYIEDWLFDAGGNGASMTYEDINELLQILDKVKN